MSRITCYTPADEHFIHCVQVLCLLSFWLLLRQTLTERQEKQKDDSSGLSDVFVEDQKKKGSPGLLFYLDYGRNNLSIIPF